MRRGAARALRAAGRGGLAPWAAGLACAAALATLVATVAIVVRLHVPLPYWDEWFTVDHYRRLAEGRYGPLNLAEQHNEHRLLFPRLVFFADERLSALSGWVDLAATLMLQAANAAILIGLAFRRAARPAHRALLAGFTMLLLFSLAQEQNFTNGFQVQFVGVFTAAALAAVLYAGAIGRARAGRAGSAPRFALAALCCFASAYTMANGVMAGPTLAVAAALARAPARTVLATLALSALLAALFFHDYVPGSSGLPAREVASHLMAYPRFVTAYLGNPMGWTVRGTQALGLLGLALLAGAAWRVARGGERDASGPALLAIAGFVVATAVATAYGRVALGTEAAFESRYATPTLIFWSALAAFWVPVALRAARPAWTAAAGVGAATAAMALLAALCCWSEVAAWPPLAARSAALRRVSDGLMAGLWDGEAAATYESTDAPRIAGFVPYLRDHRLAAFADPAYAALGRAVGAAAPAGACEGSVAAVDDPGLGSRGVRLSGRAVDLRAGRAPRRVLVADAAGTVVGFGSASLPGEPSRLWSGYARAGAGDALTVYALLGDGAPCRLGAAAVAAAPASGY